MSGQQPRYHMVPGAEAGSQRAGLPAQQRVTSPLSSSSHNHSSESARNRARQSTEDGGQDLGPYAHIRKGSAKGMSNFTHQYRSTPPNVPAVVAAAPVGYGQRGYNGNNGSPGPQLTSTDASISDRSASTKKRDKKFICFSGRGILNVLVLVILITGLLTLFAGYPIISHFTGKKESTLGAYNLGGTNGTGQVPIIVSQIHLKDPDTPQSAQTWTSPVTNNPYHLVFSDEFNTPGRTFWPNDDPFWEAQNIWYGATGDYEWYTPEQINTTNGHLLITLTDEPIHNLNFRSGMLQSWNKFCFQGGYIEFSAILPGSQTQVGWWPGLWLMGNLARPGYLGTTDGMWPYSYDSCDSGILKNQTSPTSKGYNQVSGYDKNNKIGLNWLSGQRTPACTCEGYDHPGPNNNVGRSAPELDILEAQIKNQDQGEASQSLQVAPFDMQYDWDESLATIYNNSQTTFNTYNGGVYQEAGSALSNIPAKAYTLTGNTFTKFGVDYTPDWDGNGKGSVTWYVDGQATWTVTGASFPARPDIDISQRLIPVEPMTIIMNLGISRGFQADLDFTTLTYPATMKIDYVRVYQPNSYSKDLVSCDPPDHPTSQYISDNMEVYTNPNYTTWPKTVPKNKLTGC
ncbi:concanavalin A-like lectin/glucanase [Meira miltonrushii]|uniref:Concanavalin A-like lectin/glucanase n=1 Tax=Meira miltonrushii TaxID=1280837 RepID=A0A316VFJ6_9BASI|nr:concanavalin A-like lectin/glucanase [Meira miltonrushii]PWN35093.1 concanavalin A-like lectin/glucanase [Meira miltonrushii]